ncbi:hypothetical protein CEXT_135731 [Caerostris extrusa]|uniref:Uncharacterized protein n=1 Tax=Caerostris extrusa TaxID=172846 RepID=A0AAV4Q0D1_CAEEX|nr:hypothetical protein CEXT_135731 [Caerostris extrusa]
MTFLPPIFIHKWLNIHRNTSNKRRRMHHFVSSSAYSEIPLQKSEIMLYQMSTNECRSPTHASITLREEDPRIICIYASLDANRERLQEMIRSPSNGDVLASY